MTTVQTTPALDTKQRRFKGSLAGTLVRTLLIFTFIPLALMAGVAYLRTQDLLRKQAATQSQNMLSTQTAAIKQEVNNKEARLNHLLESGSDFTILTELALHANPGSSEFSDIRNSILAEVEKANGGKTAPTFDQFLILDPNGVIKVSSNASWQSQTLDTSILKNASVEHPSFITLQLDPLYKDQLILVTARDYVNARGTKIGTLVGITDPETLQTLVQPLYGFYPLANTYFIIGDNQFITKNFETGNLALAKPSATLQGEVIPALNGLIQTQNESPQDLKTSSSKDSAFVMVQWSPELHAGIVMEMKPTAVYSGMQSLIPFTILLILGALLAMGIVMIVGANRVIKPLRSLSVITEKIAEGDWSKRAEVASQDEVGLLASSFNKMADELSRTYQSLEQKVDERTRQIRTAAEVAQNISSQPNLEEVFGKTVELLVKQFGFYQASVFMMEQSGKFIEFKTGYGEATKGLAEKKYKLEIGSESIIGWVSANNQPRVVSDVSDDPLHLKNELLPETRSEASVPISIGNLVLGVLDVQSTQSAAFSSETVVLLQTLASQIASAVQTAGLVEATQVNFEELSRLYRSSRMIAEAGDDAEIFKISQRILSKTPYSVVILTITENTLKVQSAVGNHGEEITLNIRRATKSDIESINQFLDGGLIIMSGKTEGLPSILKDIESRIENESMAYLPIRRTDSLAGVIIIGAAKQNLSSASVQPYANLADLISVSLEKNQAVRQTDRHLRELESLASINEAISSSHDQTSFFTTLHDKVRQVIGDYSLIVALYDEKTNSISIPFSYENNQTINIEAFPLGEGLTSILIHSRQPLMIVENTEKRTLELGAKVYGKPAKSWMGAPMLIKNEPIGALIIQDPENEFAFNEDDLKFFNTLAGQVAGAINNIRLLDESQRRALQLETAAEIARDISGSLNLDELLIKAVNFIRERFDFYHAAVFLYDLPQEFAVIREATGEAGAQMKRSGYKIGIGSKSIVGFVTGRGEQLVVNDITKDGTYYANPLLPDTRAEAAIPLRVGERILGALDVQSTRPYAFTEDNLRSLQILTDQLAIAVVNTELFAETQEHLSQHRLLHHITTTAASGTTLEEALEGAVTGLQVTLGGDRVSILLVDREKKKLEVKASMGYAEEINKVEVQIGSGITGWAAANRKPIRVKDVSEDPRYVEVSSNTRSELAIPLIYRNEVLGVLNAESEQVDAYTENDEEMLGTLGGSLAAIIANARLLEQIRMQAERERLVNEVTSKIRRSTDIQSILTTTASEITRITGAIHTRIEVTSENKEQEGH